VRMIKTVILLILIVELADSSKILVIPAKDSGSHLGSMIEYIYMLAEQGHSVHIFDTAFKEPKYRHPNLTTITVYVPKVDVGFNPWDILGNDPRSSGSTNWRKDLNFKETLEHHQEKFDQVMSGNWDLIVVDNLFNSHGFAVALRLKSEKGIPFILLDTCGVTTTIGSSTMSLGRNPILKSQPHPIEPKHSNDVYNPTFFTHRLYNSLLSIYETMFFNLVVQHTFMPTINEFGVNFRWIDLYKKAEFMFIDTLDKFKFPTAETTNLINIGSKCPTISNESLSQEIKDFIEDPSSKGTLYIALGTYVKWNNAPNRIIKAFGGAMKQLHDYRIVFVNNGPVDVCKNGSLPLLPNVLYVQWTNQFALLNHPKTKVFISHGGLKSIKEGICSETPIIVIPLFAEQLHNAHGVVTNNYGRLLGKFTLDENNLYSTIKEVVEDSNWKAKMSKVKSVLLDRPISSLKLALHHTERAIKGRYQEILFKPKSMEIKWITYLYSEPIILLSILILFLK